jgi:hypothetical protein
MMNHSRVHFIATIEKIRNNVLAGKYATILMWENQLKEIK